MPPFSRREFLAGSAAAAMAAAPAGGEPEMRKHVSRADLIYDKPVERSEEGIPVGNGRMGSLFWTTPNQLRLQINRVDVYANDSRTNSFFERHNDYCGGCGFVEISFGGADPFPAVGFPQRLSVYDGELSVNGRGAAAHLVAWPERDVMALEISTPAPVTVHLRMLRYESKYFGKQLETFARDHIVTVQTRSHTAESRLAMDGERILLTQDFREGDYCCKSAVAIGLIGRSGNARIANETEITLSCAAGTAPFTILIASAATFDANEDVAAAALRPLEAAREKGFSTIARETHDWWHAFWSQGYIHMSSADRTAQFIEQNYTYFLYLMAASSRGNFPPKFNGMLWNTGGDLRTWGAQHWWANFSCYYEALFAANHLELLEPAFHMYSGMYAACSTAARQQWNSQGIYIPETVYFDGLEKLPDDIAAEMSELYLLRKPWDQRSARFRAYAETKHPHSSRWNWNESGSYVDGRWVIKERGSGPYGPTSHILGSTAKIAYLYWRRYEFTQDREWLRERAYPMLKGAAEFYRNFPNVRKGDDGKYHIHRVNSNESVWGARDTDEDLSAMRGVLCALLQAATLLNIDADLRPKWREFLDLLAPLPTSADPEALRPASYNGPAVFVRGLKPAVKAGGLQPDGNSLPMWFFDLCHVQTSDRERLAVAQATLNGYFRGGLSEHTQIGVLSKVAIAAASLGRADAVRFLIPNQIQVISPERGTAYKNGGVLANRMTLREGPQALDAERLGRASEALQLALLQSFAPSPGEDPIIHLFPAWPAEWDAQFKLRARGAFVVTASIAKGAITNVQLESLTGAPCRLRNPWDDAAVSLLRDGKNAEKLSGSLLAFETRVGETIELKNATGVQGSDAAGKPPRARASPLR